MPLRRKPARQRTERVVTLYTVAFLSAGAVAAALGSFLKICNPKAPVVLATSIDILINLGIGMISLAVFGYLLNMKDWTEYFRARLAEIIQDDEHLAKLNQEELSRLQAALLKRFYNNPSIDEGESFLHFLRERVQSYIDLPFRENYDYQVSFRESGEEEVEITEFFVYYCRSVGRGIMDEISWEANKQLLDRTKELQLRLFIPTALEKQRIERNVPAVIDYLEAKLKADHWDEDTGVFRVSLDEFDWVDGLMISFRHCYTAANDVPFSYRWRHPIRNLVMTVDYPPRYQLAYSFYGIDEQDLRAFAAKGRLNVRVDSWIPPRSGFYLALHERPDPSASPPQEA